MAARKKMTAAQKKAALKRLKLPMLKENLHKLQRIILMKEKAEGIK